MPLLSDRLGWPGRWTAPPASAAGTKRKAGAWNGHPGFRGREKALRDASRPTKVIVASQRPSSVKEGVDCETETRS